jgi:hypothetical protein
MQLSDKAILPMARQSRDIAGLIIGALRVPHLENNATMKIAHTKELRQLPIAVLFQVYTMKRIFARSLVAGGALPPFPTPTMAISSNDTGPFAIDAAKFIKTRQRGSDAHVKVAMLRL